VRVCLGIILLVLACLPAAGAKAAAPVKARPAVRSLSYQQTISGATEKRVLKVSVKGAKYRLDMGTSVLVCNGKQSYVYMPATKSAYPVPLAAQIPVPDGSPQALALALGRSKKVGRETVGGHLCDVYTMPVPGRMGGAPGDTMKTWVWREQNLPVKCTILQGKQLTTVEISAIQLGAVLADRLFELPPGVKVLQSPQPPQPR